MRKWIIWRHQLHIYSVTEIWLENEHKPRSNNRHDDHHQLHCYFQFSFNCYTPPGYVRSPGGPKGFLGRDFYRLDANPELKTAFSAQIGNQRIMPQKSQSLLKMFTLGQVVEYTDWSVWKLGAIFFCNIFVCKTWGWLVYAKLLLDDCA